MVIYGRCSLFLALVYARWKNKLDQSERRVDRLRAGLIWLCAGHIEIIVFRDVTSCSLVEVHPCSATITSPSVTQQPNSGLGRSVVEVPISHTITHTHTLPVGLLWKSDCLVAEAAINTQQTQETNIFALTGVQTRDRKPTPSTARLSRSAFGRIDSVYLPYGKISSAMKLEPIVFCF